MIFAIIEKATGKVEEYRNTKDAVGALSAFLEVPSYNASNYEAIDATDANRKVPQKWDGSVFVAEPVVDIREEMDKLSQQMDEELAKPSPDPIVAMKLMRQREKMERG